MLPNDAHTHPAILELHHIVNDVLSTDADRRAVSGWADKWIAAFTAHIGPESDGTFATMTCEQTDVVIKRIAPRFFEGAVTLTATSAELVYLRPGPESTTAPRRVYKDSFEVRSQKPHILNRKWGNA